MDFSQQYRVIESRDARFDGQFFTAVRTTGIYCRPSCPARTPKPANVSFFRTSAAAHEAGYRACKRCLPEAVPGSPEWNVRSDVAARAMRLIADGVMDRGGVPELSARLGYSSRQLNRIMTAELGAGPLALARASRAQTARTLLTATDIKASDIAFAAGFSSVRQFNETVAEVFSMTPTALRTRGQHRHPHVPSSSPAVPGSTAGPPAELSLALPFRKPFDPGIFAFLAARSVLGVEEGNASRYARALALPCGHGCFELRWTGTALELSARLEDLRDLPALLSRVRRLLDLDADPAGIDAVLSVEPGMARRVAMLPGIRLPGALDAGEILIRAMIGQQITVAAARTALNQLAAVGLTGRTPSGTLLRHFPTPELIAEYGPEILRGPRKRIESVCAVARMLATGELAIGLEDDLTSLSAKLLPLPGIGPWTVGYVAMRVLGAPDIFLPTDAAVRNGFARLSESPVGQASGGDAGAAAGIGASVLTGYAARFSPWRSYATMHLWRAATAVPTTTAPAEAPSTTRIERASQ
ncbi:DNA-3-methyladenine glycosylase 2 family protein [Arthrobacter sp. H14-L1]|uniref:DNA-3-methyladenine glycosylase 2 family protein n=1 Tax=Arthrobacter sp. H14-L1 TaxID=2996697 RepID=UPI00226D6BA7|nr:Ada metal-binding domain-containing protein [Arthrobacter sp. H14-L1]MCY0904786.1 helix-turn-helix domain-containing protein [Arthrobacter sp. H14-L1]